MEAIQAKVEFVDDIDVVEALIPGDMTELSELELALVGGGTGEVTI